MFISFLRIWHQPALSLGAGPLPRGHDGSPPHVALAPSPCPSPPGDSPVLPSFLHPWLMLGAVSSQNFLGPVSAFSSTQGLELGAFGTILLLRPFIVVGVRLVLGAGCAGCLRACATWSRHPGTWAPVSVSSAVFPSVSWTFHSGAPIGQKLQRRPDAFLFYYFSSPTLFFFFGLLSGIFCRIFFRSLFFKNVVVLFLTRVFLFGDVPFISPTSYPWVMDEMSPLSFWNIINHQYIEILFFPILFLFSLTLFFYLSVS